MKAFLPFALTASLLASTTAALAQTTVRLGLRGGAHRALTTLDAASNYAGTYPFSGSASKAALYAWQAGVVAEVSCGRLAVQPALLFSQKGEKLDATTSLSGIAGYNVQQTVSTNRYNWLELSLPVVYTRPGDHGWQLFAGPYVALAVGGHRQGTTTSAFYGPPTYTVPTTSKTTDLAEQVAYGTTTPNRRFDAGINVGVGYRQGPLQVQAGYGLGLLDLHHIPSQGEYGPDPDAATAYNRVVQLTGTYFFSL